MAAVAEVRHIPLDRRLCVVRPDRIDIRPSRGALLGPFIGLAIGVVLLSMVGLFLNRLPAAGLAALLVPALLVTPLGAMGFVYSFFGAHVIFERQKQSGRFQQGLLGLGLGTVELVPFWKIDQIVVEEFDLGERDVGRLPSPLDLVAFDVVLVKTSGKRLSVGQVIVPDDEELVAEGFGRAVAVAEAIGALVDKPVRIDVPLAEEGEESPQPQRTSE